MTDPPIEFQTMAGASVMAAAHSGWLLHLRLIFPSQVERVLRRMIKFSKPNKTAPVCLLCPTVVWRSNQPDVTILIIPNLNDPRQIACQFVCHTCCSGFTDGTALNSAVQGINE
jgi:hypothetical protein